MIGSSKPRLAHLPGGPRPDRRRQLRRPARQGGRRRRRAARPLAARRAARRGGRRRGLRAERRRPRPGRLRLGAGRRRGDAAPAHGADRGGPPADLPLRLLHRAPRRRAQHRQRGALRLPLAAGRVGVQPDRQPGRREPRAAAARGRATASTSTTSPAFTPGSTRSPASSRWAPRGGRSAAASWPSRCASSRSPATWSRCSAPCWPPVRSRAGCPSAARSARRRLLIGEMTVSGS